MKPIAATSLASASPALRNVVHTHRFAIDAKPARVFPLLCPTREHDWIPAWRCQLLHSSSGFAEQDCIFRTQAPDGDTMTWVVSRYEPSRRIEFTCFVPDRYVMRLSIALAPAGTGTELTWTRRFLALGPADGAFASVASPAALDEKMAALERLLAHYVHTGEALHP